MKIHKYPDGTSYAELDSSSKPDFTFRINSYEDVIHLIQIIEAFNHKKIIPTVTIPNMIDAQADKRFGENQSSGLKIICTLLNSVEANYKVFHPHNGEVLEALLPNVEIIDNSEFIKTVLSKLNEKDINPIILLPDGGAYKWGVKLMDKIGFKGDVLAAAKNRQYVDGKSVLTQQLPNYNFTGKPVLIIDDLLIGGTTLINLAEMLQLAGASSVHGVCSHATVKTPRKEIEGVFDSFYTSNSKYEQDEYYLKPSIFKVLKEFLF